jgi:hypothetical protein
MANRTLVDDPLQILISYTICREKEVEIFQTEGD